MVHTVYVVAWEYNGGGGFDWYADRPQAERAFLDEDLNAQVLKESQWKAALFPFESELQGEALTDAIDTIIWENAYPYVKQPIKVTAK